MRLTANGDLGECYYHRAGWGSISPILYQNLDRLIDLDEGLHESKLRRRFCILFSKLRVDFFFYSRRSHGHLNPIEELWRKSSTQSSYPFLFSLLLFLPISSSPFSCYLFIYFPRTHCSPFLILFSPIPLSPLLTLLSSHSRSLLSSPPFIPSPPLLFRSITQEYQYSLTSSLAS